MPKSTAGFGVQYCVLAYLFNLHVCGHAATLVAMHVSGWFCMGNSSNISDSVLNVAAFTTPNLHDRATNNPSQGMSLAKLCKLSLCQHYRTLA